MFGKYRTLNLWTYYLGVLSIILVALWGPISTRLSLILDYYQVRPDALQHNFPYWSFLGQEYFQNNYIAEYYLEAIIPFGLKTTFVSLAHFFTPIQIGKGTSIILAILFVYLLTESSRVLAGKIAGLVTAFFTTAYLVRHFIFSDSISRSFGYVVIALGLYAIVNNRHRLYLIATCLGALFYPAAGAMLACYLGVISFWPALGTGNWPRYTLRLRLFQLFMLGIVLLILLLPMLLGGKKYGDRLYIKNQSEYPETGLGGRYSPQDLGINYRPLGSIIYRSINKIFLINKQLFSKTQLSLKAKGQKKIRYDGDRQILFWSLLLLACLGLIRKLYLERTKIPVCWQRLFALFVSMVLIYYLAELLFPHLYMPSRYPLITLPVLALVVIPALLVQFSYSFKSKYFTSIGLVVCLGMIVYLSGIYEFRFRINSGYRPNQNIYKFIEKLPAKSLVAGWPIGMIDSVPYFTGKGAFVTMETHQVFHSKYLLEMRSRTYDLIDALFDNSLLSLQRLRDRHGVTHLLVEQQFLKKRPQYFAPFGDYLKTKVAWQERTWINIFKSKVMQSATIHRSGKVSIVDLRLLPR